jgi:hypothetical protein
MIVLCGLLEKTMLVECVFADNIHSRLAERHNTGSHLDQDWREGDRPCLALYEGNQSCGIDYVKPRARQSQCVNGQVANLG